HGVVLMWLMKTLLTSRCINQRGAGHHTPEGLQKMHRLKAHSIKVFTPNDAMRYIKKRPEGLEGQGLEGKMRNLIDATLILLLFFNNL
ncbi:hypothetical protein SBS95_27395, partial [Klebsiella pneumoniae]